MKPTLKLYVAVGLGGMIGAVFRYMLSVLVESSIPGYFPLSTFLVNISGAFLLTFLMFSPIIQKHLSPVILTSLTTGIIGSFTTFSTIQLEIVRLLEHHMTIAFLYIGSTMLFGLLSSYLGYYLANFWCIRRTDQ